MRRFKFKSSQRLKSQTDFNSVFQYGVKFDRELLTAKFISHPSESHENYLQAAFIVSKKLFRKAVQRNRIRRLMREAFRLHYSDYPQIKGKILLIYKKKNIPEYPQICKELLGILDDIIKLKLHENPK